VHGSQSLAARSSPGLRALLIYLRPAPRTRLLALLADLGIFVVEHQGSDRALDTAYATRTDLIIVVGDDVPEHAALAGSVLAALSSVLVVLTPGEIDERAYRAAGAAAIIPDTVSEEEFIRALGPAVQQARGLRSLGELAAEFIICGDVLFRTSPPELHREGRAVPLARTESAVLLELSRTPGKLVRTVDLERRLAALSARGEPHTGYVKTVVMRLRHKVQDLGGNPARLRNVRGIGYMLVE